MRPHETALTWAYYRLMVPLWRRRFAPRTVDVVLADRRFRFFIASPQAAAWYDPPKAYTLAEYDWLIRNVEFGGQEVIDAGAHHGHYSLVFASGKSKPKSIAAVEPLPSNCAIIEVNAALNRADINVIEAAVATSNRFESFLPRSNGKLYPGVGINVRTLTLAEINRRASIVKLDIEGTEFDVLKEQIDHMKDAHTWIVEVHPRYGDATCLAQEFSQRGFAVRFLDKTSARIMTYSVGVLGNQSTTLISTR